MKGERMVKEKLNFLKEVYPREEFLTLPLDAAKLYLVLLIAAEWPEKEGNISFKTIKKALGHPFLVNRLEKAVSALSDRGLIQFDQPFTRMSANHFHHDLQLYYKIKELPLATK